MASLALIAAGSLVAGLGLLSVLCAVNGLGILLLTPGVALAWLGMLQRRTHARQIDATRAAR